MAFLVIMIHTITPTSNFSFTMTQGISRIAVPFFLISAGYFFSKKSTNKDLLKTVVRLTSLYIIWCILYSPFIVSELYKSSQNALELTYKTAYILIKGWRHLWFMPAMIFGIITYHIIKNKRYKYHLALSFYCIGVVLQNVVPVSEYSIILYRNFLLFGFPMIALGSFLRDVKAHSIQTRLLIIYLICSLTLLLIESQIKYNFKLYNNDMLISAPFVAAALFTLSNKVFPQVNQEIRAIASNMYFIHFLFYLMFISVFQNQLITFLIVSLCSFASSIFLVKSKYYRRIFN